ncbi:MAG: hypothetical protein NZ455_13990 [Bacteroidia bacterium]|nr:hypothetical protein [Bacteroidia bacterium]MDW8346737.1 hypothetical protein [Bacteroidia bacterium]
MDYFAKLIFENCVGRVLACVSLSTHAGKVGVLRATLRFGAAPHPPTPWLWS